MKKLIYFLLSLTVFVSCNLSETKKKLEEEDKKKAPGHYRAAQ